MPVSAAVSFGFPAKFIFRFWIPLLIACLASGPGAASTGASAALRPEVEAFIAEMVRKHEFERDALRRVFAKVQSRPAIIRAMTAPLTALPWHQFRERFVDPARALVADKSEAGRRLRVYERPGLWNGAMAGWNTLFVEVPAWTFAPVKTVLDLARPEHLDPTRSSLRKR